MTRLCCKCRRLLPALLRLGEAATSEATRGQALRYVEFALDRLQCQVRLLLPLGCLCRTNHTCGVNLNKRQAFRHTLLVHLARTHHQFHFYTSNMQIW